MGYSRDVGAFCFCHPPLVFLRTLYPRYMKKQCLIYCPPINLATQSGLTTITSTTPQYPPFW